MIRSWILVETGVGHARNAERDIRGLKGVIDAGRVTGPYDLIVQAQGSDLQGVARVVDAMHQVKGVLRTVTCHVLHSS